MYQILILKLILSVMTVYLLASCQSQTATNHSNILRDDRMLLVLVAPSINNSYYKSVFSDIVDFHVRYARAILGNDNVVVVVDKQTRPYYRKYLPADILLTDELYDIWARDFTTVNPLSPIQFRYTSASMSTKESRQVQSRFNAFANDYRIDREKSDWIIDGGNIVDNYQGGVITTTRFLDDNQLTLIEAKKVLKSLLQTDQVAIIEPDDDVLAHADGMVMWLDKNTLLVNDYFSNPEFNKLVLNELKTSFPQSKIIPFPVEYKETTSRKWGEIESACGVNLNSVLTFNNIYVPTFNMPHDTKALAIIHANTSKKVIEVSAEQVCEMGGSVRCLTWQLTGNNAKIIILAARKDE
jgi:agmatine/peptidylarginine deiminase